MPLVKKTGYEGMKNLQIIGKLIHTSSLRRVFYQLDTSLAGGGKETSFLCSVPGCRRLVVGGWLLVASGCWWWLVAGCWWLLVAAGGCLLVAGGWRLLATDCRWLAPGC